MWHRMQPSVPEWWSLDKASVRPRRAANDVALGGGRSLPRTEADDQIRSVRNVERPDGAVRRRGVGARLRALVAPARVRPFFRVPDNRRRHESRAATRAGFEYSQAAVTKDQHARVCV